MASAHKKEFGRLERKILDLLAKGGAISVHTLAGELKRRGDTYSVQAIYYVLRKMRREGVALRVEGGFSLSLPWSLELLELAKEIEERFVRQAPAMQLLPDHLARRSWTFTSLTTLDDVWVQLMLVLLEKEKANTIYNYSPHPWFYFAQPRKMDRFYRVLERTGRKVELLIGGETPLDLLFSRSAPKTIYRCAHVGFLPELPHTHLMVIGDHVIRVSLHRKLSRERSIAHSKQ